MRILILDDNRALAHLLCLYLRKEGFSVTAFFCPHETLRNIQSHDVLLTDYHMPEMTGLELASRAYDQGWRGSLYLMSGRVAEIKEPIEHPLLCKILHKPFSTRDLVKMLRSKVSGPPPG